MIHRLALVLLLAASPAMALDLAPPSGTEQARIETPSGSVRLPRTAWQPGTVIDGTEGAVRKIVYTVPNPALTTLQLLDPLRKRLEEAGYEEIYTCADAACGGFDFRFQLDLIPAPAMHVDLGNYRYLLAEKPGANPRIVALVASSTSTAGYLHVTELSDRQAEAIPDDQPEQDPENATTQSPASSNLIATLKWQGHAVLPDLEFSTGSSTLDPGRYASLQELASWLAETPGARVVLVGHTDSVGSLGANQSLSSRRAQSVMERLTGTYGTNPAQLQADGAGALSPIASNLNEAGRAANRRVEVVLLSVE